MGNTVQDLEPLVAAAAAGDREAFGHLVTATSGVVSSISLAILGDLDASRDVAQDVFLAAWRDLRKLRNPASFLPWLRQMARNRAHHVLRSRVRARRREADAVTEEYLATINDPRPDAAAALTVREDAEVLAEVLASLPDETREVLTLFYREGQSVAQVAALLDLTGVTVRKRLSRARATLRESLLERAATSFRNTAPGAAFTASVLAGLSLGWPAGVSASTLAATKTVVKAGLGAKLLLIVGSALPGAAGGMAGVLLGSRHLSREARDDDERRGIVRFRIVSCLVVALFALGFPIGHQLTGWRLWPVANFTAFIVALAILQHGWLPRILRRRFEAEQREDPERAHVRRERERRAAILGWSLGLTFGTLGLILGMLMS